ncbi:MAG TPA: helix-turn-helix transcriptional regulator [Jatrophihabitantaceae bacterium]
MTNASAATHPPAELLAALPTLPPGARAVLLILASNHTSDPVVVLRAAQALGACADDLAAVERARLLVRPTPTTLAFAHPSIRLATHHGASTHERWAAHRAVAEALGGDVERLIQAAETAAQCGEPTRATMLIDRAEPLADDPLMRAGLNTVRGRVSFAAGDLPAARRQLRAALADVSADRPHDALWLLLELAQLSDEPDEAAVTALNRLRLPDTDPLLPIRDLAKWMYQRHDPASRPPQRALPDTVRAALGLNAGDPRRRLLVLDACLVGGDNVSTHQAISAAVDQIRGHGRIGLLPAALIHLGHVQIYRGELRAARATAAEAARVAEDVHQPEWISQASCLLALLAALDGDEHRCRSHTDTALRAGPTRRAVAGISSALGLLDLALGRPASALARLEVLAHVPVGAHLYPLRSVPDLVEAAVRSRQPARAARALARFEQWAVDAQQPWIDALLLRCRALLASDSQAEHLYLRALTTHEPDRPIDLARTTLLYGEWLRRTRRRLEARAQLRTALAAFESLRLRPWAQRTRNELRATGEANPAASPDSGAVPLDQLTPQELQVARLAATGMSNRAIGDRLFLSHRTVSYHLYKAYPKLGVACRTELAWIDGLRPPHTNARPA